MSVYTSASIGKPWNYINIFSCIAESQGSFWFLCLFFIPDYLPSSRMEILALIILNMFTYLIILLLRNQTPFAAPSCSFAKTLSSSCMMVIPSKDSLSLPSLPPFVDTTLTADIWHTFLLLWWPSASGVQYYSLSFLCRYLVFFWCKAAMHWFSFPIIRF